MLSIQRSLFSNGIPSGLSFLSEGCYSQVYEVAGRPDMVVKQCREHDGTLAWLMWSVRNQGRKGVPIIESLVLTDVGYLCTMKRYESMSQGSPREIRGQTERDSWWRGYHDADGVFKQHFGPGKPERFGTYGNPAKLPEYSYLIKLQEDFEQQTGLEWSDIHHNNYMWCNETQCIVITDPASGGCDVDEIQRNMDNWSTAEPFTLTMQ